MDQIEKLLKESIEYFPETGKFFWKEDRPLEHFHSLKSKRRWLRMFAGKEITGSCVYGNIEYINIRLNNRKLKAHRVAWWFATGEWPRGEIDHIDGNGLNNKILNLRDVPKQLNMRNSGLSKNNSSGVNGVNQRKDNGKWVARGSILSEGKHVRVYLGQYETLDEAVKARENWEKLEGNFTERHGK